MTKPRLTMDMGISHRENRFVAVGRALSRVGEVEDQQ